MHDPAERMPLVYRTKTGPHVLRKNATLDLGTITVHAAGAILLRLPPGEHEIRIDDLPPGTYWATLEKAGMASVVLTDLVVEPRRTATRDIVVTAGVQCSLKFRMARAPESATSLHIRAVDADGNCVMDDWYTRGRAGTFWGGTWAAERTYTVEAETKTGERARGQFTVPEGGTKPNQRIEVQLN